MTELHEICDVSRETEVRLRHLEDLVRTWTQRINLVSRATVDEIWTRHILDSAQFFAAAPPNPTAWVDLGSGGGFPGLVVALLGTQAGWKTRFTLMESDQRKATFLRIARRELGLPAVEIHPGRIEAAAPLAANVVSARALAPLPRLMPLVYLHLAPEGCALLAKGANAATEIEEAKSNWRFEIEEIPSRTDENGRLLRLERIERV